MSSTYQLTCTACLYRERVEGLDASYGLEEAHQREHGEAHFVDVQLLDENDGAATPDPREFSQPMRASDEDLAADDD